MNSCNEDDFPLNICIIGAGFSGLCAAIQLKKQLGLESFTIFEENHDVGGTWLVNTYPGCACDVPSHLYSFSFEPNSYWTKSYAGQQEILEYVQHVTKKYELYQTIKFQHRVSSVTWDENKLIWQVTVADIRRGQAQTLDFDIVISGMGVLRVPNIPPQFNTFDKQKTIHSANWDSSTDLKDKVVAIVGTGASAVQIVPQIVDKVKRLIVYQRKPAWVIPQGQMSFPESWKWALANVPGVQWVLRNLIFWSYEVMYSTFQMNTAMGKLSEKYAKWHLARQVPDVQLRQKLTPNYTFGCKRVTPSNFYYPAMTKSNVTLVTCPIKEITLNSILTEDGSEIAPDILILATGYKVQDYFAPTEVTSRGGENLFRKWKKNGPSAYAGIVSHDAPNMFFLLGPNTGTGHNSALFNIECQVNYVVQVIGEMRRRKARLVSIKKSVEEEYMNNILTSLKSTVWGASDCGAWYADHRGVVTALWPESLVSYWKLTRVPDFSLFEFEQ